MKEEYEIKIATAKTCQFCNGKGYFQNQGGDTCKKCGGNGKVIGELLTIEKLKKLLGI
jgi:DnaJ-class molecular chaperone